MNDAVLSDFAEKLSEIPHLKRLRFHTRMPIMLPERVTPEFIRWVTGTRLAPIIVVHCNHPQEINSSVVCAMQDLADAQVTLLNQAVLLKGVNDCVETLVALSEALFSARILPYYLNVLDKTQGTAHFDIPLEQARHLHQQMASRLSGWLVPRLVREQVGAPAKSRIENGVPY
jgi:KamA family protein